MTKKLCIKLVLVLATAPLEAVSFAQSPPPSLADPKLTNHASLPQNNLPGLPLARVLADSREQAPSRGVTWKGLEIAISDDEVASPSVPLNTLLSQLYRRQVCQADAVIVGHATASASHLSALGTTIFSDYVVSVDTLLKDNGTSSIRPQAQIIVTRPGGSLSLADGPVTMDFKGFPRLENGVTYLMLLRYLPQSSSYQAIDPFSTLTARGSNWIISRKAFADVSVPGFTRGALESAVGAWITSCKEGDFR